MNARLDTGEGAVPTFLTPKPENIPLELQALPCAVWKGEPRPAGGFGKRPRHPMGHPLSVGKPEQWADFAECLPAVKASRFDGIGVLLTGETDTNGDHLLGGDIDHADTTLGENPELGRAIRKYQKRGGYVDRSPSGTGIRAFWRGTTPDPGRKCGGVEIYRDRRFLTVTGHGQGVILRDPELTAAFLKAINGGQPAPQAGPTKGAAVLPFPTAAKPTTAQLDRIEARVREQVGTVWDGQWESWSNDLGSGGFASQSDADFHVCAVIARNALATDIDPAHLAETIEEVFGRSALAERDKWQTNAYYRDRTIGNAIKAVTKERAPREQGGEASQGEGQDDTPPDSIGFSMPPVPPFDVEQHLPACLAGYVRDQAELMGTPPETIAVPLVVGMGAALGNRVELQPKRHDGTWMVGANLWGFTCASPGRMKSETGSRGLAPVKALEKILSVRYGARRNQYEIDKVWYEVELT